MRVTERVCVCARGGYRERACVGRETAKTKEWIMQTTQNDRVITGYSNAMQYYAMSSRPK